MPWLSALSAVDRVCSAMIHADKHPDRRPGGHTARLRHLRQSACAHRVIGSAASRGDPSAREALAIDGASHRDAGPPGEAASLFMFADAAEPIGDLIFSHDLEAEPLVIGCVPRNVGVGGQRQSSEAVLLSPCGGGVQECLAQTLSSMVGVHGDLLDMGVPINHVEEEVGHGTIRVVGDDPGPTVLLEAGQLGDGWRFIVCDGSHVKVAERRTGCSLELANSRQVFPASGPEHGDILGHRWIGVIGRRLRRRTWLVPVRQEDWSAGGAASLDALCCA